jgi:hypothetical protein
MRSGGAEKRGLEALPRAADGCVRRPCSYLCLASRAAFINGVRVRNGSAFWKKGC